MKGTGPSLRRKSTERKQSKGSQIKVKKTEKKDTLCLKMMKNPREVESKLNSNGTREELEMKSMQGGENSGHATHSMHSPLQEIVSAVKSS